MLRLLLILLVLPSFCFGQCTADAGNDTFVCLPLVYVDTVQLGGNPTASGGFPPYTYTWETIYVNGNFTYHASDFLDDTTLANPNIIGFGPEKLTFYLTVTDSLTNMCIDSVVALYSYFYTTLQDKMAWIIQGDSVQLYSSGGVSRPPETFFWTPNYNLSDQNIAFPYASPDTFTAYQNIITDSLGCQMTDPDLFEVYIIPVGISNIESISSITLHPNPTTGIFTVQGTVTAVQVYDLYGRLVLRTNEEQVDMSSYPAGIYMVRLVLSGVEGEAVRKLILH